MKFSTQEEYGLRLLLRIAKAENALTIPELSQLEGLTTANVGKILRILRIGGFIDAERGQNGGYRLTAKPENIILSNVLSVLGGRLFENDFCNDHKGVENICTNSIDCSIRSLWKKIQNLLDSVLGKMTLNDLIGDEQSVDSLIDNISEQNSN